MLLPSQAHGPVVLPDPPGKARDLAGALEAVVADFENGSAAPLR
jgi:hypothetical protein